LAQLRKQIENGKRGQLVVGSVSGSAYAMRTEQRVQF